MLQPAFLATVQPALSWTHRHAIIQRCIVLPFCCTYKELLGASSTPFFMAAVPPPPALLSISDKRFVFSLYNWTPHDRGNKKHYNVYLIVFVWFSPDFPYLFPVRSFHSCDCYSCWYVCFFIHFLCLVCIHKYRLFSWVVVQFFFQIFVPSFFFSFNSSNHFWALAYNVQFTLSRSLARYM